MTEHDIHDDPRVTAAGAIANLAAGFAELLWLLQAGEVQAVHDKKTDLIGARIMAGSLISYLDDLNAARRIP